jgi:phage baseplate assembly protein W
MAKQRKEYRYNPIDFKKDVAVGVMLPFGKNSGLFSLSYSTEEQSVSNLKNLLLTKKGERPFQPEFGSDVYTLMFEQMNAELSNTLTLQLSDDIAFWLPYIVIDDITVTPDYDRNTVNITLSYRITEQGTNRQIIMFIDSTGTSILE